MVEHTARKRAIAQRLRAAREQAGLTQGQIAKLLNMHRPTVSEIEAGRRRVSADELAMFARHYGVRPEWLLGEDEAVDLELRLAARQFEKLTPEDRQRVFEFLRSLAHGKPNQ